MSEELIERLKPFLEHKRDCVLRKHWTEPFEPYCNCGLAQALARPTPAKGDNEKLAEVEIYRHIHQIARDLGYPSTLEALEALAAKASQKPTVPTHWNGAGKYGSAFSFEPGLLGVNIAGYGGSDGNGYFAFKEDDLEFEQDDGPLYRTVNIDNSELLAIRDHLNSVFPPEAEASPAVEVERLREALREAESETRRFAEIYPLGTDGRNTFTILADKIAALTTHDKGKKG